MEDYSWGLIDGPSIDRINVIEDEFPDLPRLAIDRLAFAASIGSTILACGAFAATIGLSVLDPPSFTSYLIAGFATIVVAYAISTVISWMQTKSLARRWAERSGFEIEPCELDYGEIDEISRAFDPTTPMQTCLRVLAKGDPRGNYRGILVVGHPIFGKRRFCFRYVAVGYSR